MATETKIIEIKIEYGGALSRIAELTNAIDNLSKKEIKAGETVVQYKNRMAEHTATIKMHRQEIALLSREVANKFKVDQQELGHIEKLKAEVSNLTLAYERLTKAELEGTKGATVLNNLKSKREELSSLNQAYGNYSANVGNYSSATKMLGINLGQVMKEMPNFAISARIGIMSLTNNLPMLAESIKAVRLEQQAMIAAGQKAPSMFSLISKSIFGLTGFMSIAMVIMQIYGADIIKWVGSLFKATKATDVLKESHDNFIKSLKEGGGEYAKAVSDLEEMVAVMAAVEKGFIKKTDAVEEYNEKFGETIGEIKTYDQLEANMIKLVPKYVEAMAIKQEANLKLAEAVKLQGEIRALEEEQTITFWQKFGSTVITTFKDILTLKTDIFSMPSQLMQNAKLAEANILKDKSLDAKKKKEELDVLIKEYRIKFAEFAATGFSGIGDNKDKKEKAKETFDYEKELRDLQTKQIENQYQKEIQTAIDKYNEDAKKYKEALDKKLISTTQYANLIKELNEKAGKEFFDINDKWDKKIQDIARSSIKALNQVLKEELDQTDLDVKAMLENLIKQLNASVSDADTELATKQLLGMPDLDEQYALLDAERKLAVTQARLKGEDLTALEAYYAAKRAKIENELNRSKLASVADVIGSISGMLEEGSIAQKVAATAQATINTYLGATGAFAQTPGDVITKSLAAAAAVASGLASVYQIWKVDTNVPDTNTSSSSTTSQVTEKYHTGGDVGSKADSNLKSNEVTATLLRGERILSNQQSSVFNSILGNIKMLGGSENITKSVGINADAQMQVMEIAFTRALARQKAPILDYSQFTTFVNKQVKFEQNTRI